MGEDYEYLWGMWSGGGYGVYNNFHLFCVSSAAMRGWSLGDTYLIDGCSAAMAL
jgi:hypothetical protein